MMIKIEVSGIKIHVDIPATIAPKKATETIGHHPFS
jgi:hypothetical protein